MRIAHTIFAVTIAAIIPATGSAQLGGLVRKAKDAAEKKVVDTKNLKPSSTFGPELTAESLDGVLRGLAAAQGKLDQVKQLNADRERLSSDYAKSSSEHESDRQKYDTQREKVESCQSDIIHQRGNSSQDAYMKKMQSDPAAQAQMLLAAKAMSEKVAAAQAKGDTAAVRRLSFDLAKAYGIDPAADTAAAIKTCGPKPAKPAWLVEQESLRDRSTRLEQQVRQTEENAGTAAEAASGMTRQAYSLARERVLNWYQETHGGPPVQVLGSDERKLMESHRSDIEKFRNALR